MNERRKKVTKVKWLKYILAVRLFQYQVDFQASKMVIDTQILRENFKDDVRECVKKRDWQKVLKLNQKYGSQLTYEFLWVFPTEFCLNSLKNLMKNYNITNVLSIGCGYGLLEFMLRESIGLKSEFEVLSEVN